MDANAIYAQCVVLVVNQCMCRTGTRYHPTFCRKFKTLTGTDQTLNSVHYRDRRLKTLLHEVYLPTVKFVFQSSSFLFRAKQVLFPTTKPFVHQVEVLFYRV